MLNNIWLRLLILCIALPLVRQIAQAQCSDATTQAVYYSGVIRNGGNDVWTYAGAEVTGNYYLTWTTAVTLTERLNGSIFQSRQNVYATAGFGGNSTMLSYHDALSSSGPGDFTLSVFHEWGSSCGNYISTTSNKSLTVQRPTINAYGIYGVWWLGGGSDGSNGYYNTAVLGANKNCNPGDTCNETPAWSLTQLTPQKLMLNSSTGTSTTVTSLSASSAPGDITIKFNIGGFESEPLYFTVNAPYTLEARTSLNSHVADSDGYDSKIYYSIREKMYSTRMPSIALNESFGTWENDDTTNNWAKGTAGGLASFAPNDYWYDNIAISGCSLCSPGLQNPQTPLGSTTIDHVAQTWRVGNATVGSGVKVQTDRLQRFRDHGDHPSFYIVTPVP